MLCFPLCIQKCCFRCDSLKSFQQSLILRIVKNLIILSNGENVSPEEIENKLALNPLIGEVIVTGEDNGLTARIYPEQAVVEAKALDAEAIQAQLQAFLDEYNRNQPTYRRITGLVVRKNPFIRNTTKKIRRQDVLIDEPLE